MAGETITTGGGRYRRDPDGTWRYADSGVEVPGAEDMTISSLYNLEIRRGEVLVPRELAEREDELAWCLEAGDDGRLPGVIRVPVAEWDRRAAEPLGMWAPELADDPQVRELALAESEYRHERARLDAELRAAQRRRDERFRRAAQAGMSYRQIAAATGLAHQRIAQIVSETDS